MYVIVFNLQNVDIYIVSQEDSWVHSEGNELLNFLIEFDKINGLFKPSSKVYPS